MESITITRRVDELGRIVLPVDMRKLMGLEPGNEVQIEYKNHEITLSMPKSTCRICGSPDELVDIEGAQICMECAKKMSNIVNK